MPRERSKRREANVKNTETVERFLDKFLYKPENGFEKTERIFDKQRQVSGVDVISTIDGTKWYVDEKAATDYVNKNLTTFSLELSFINRAGEIQDGWFLNNKLSTTAYLFVWVDSGITEEIQEDVNLITENGITSLTAALVKKKDIKTYLENLGWSEHNLRSKAIKIRYNKPENMGEIVENGVKFCFSRKFVEGPVNILLPRQKLIDLSEKHWTFTP